MKHACDITNVKLIEVYLSS